MRSLRVLGSMLSVAVLGSACAAAPPRASSARESARPEAPEPTTIAEAESQLDRAYRQLGGARSLEAGGLAGREKPTQGGAATAHDKGDHAPPPPPAAPPADPPKGATAKPGLHDDALPEATPKKDTAADQRADESSPCRQACRAFASLRRAVDAVCRLAGDPSDKCAAARDRQKEVESRVTTCGC